LIKLEKDISEKNQKLILASFIVHNLNDSDSSESTASSTVSSQSRVKKPEVMEKCNLEQTFNTATEAIH